MDMQRFWADAPRTGILEATDPEGFRAAIQSRGRPAVIRGAVSDWPAVKAARRSDQALIDLLRSQDRGVPIQAFFAPGVENGRYGYNEDFTGFNFERREIAFSHFLDLLLTHAGDETAQSMYAGAVPVPKHVPGLADSHSMPLLEPGQEHLASLWLGNRSRTAGHWDLPQNLACVIGGRRRFILFPIEQVPNLYIGPLDHTLAGQPISLVDVLDPDFEAHPRFRDAIEHAEVAELEPGDVLYLPSLWVHHVESLDPVGVMLNFWWREAPAHMVTPYLTLLHSLLTLRDLPARERAAWRVLFDHYIFNPDDTDPMAHLPETARGLYGELTPEKVARIRAFLARSLSRP